MLGVGSLKKQLFLFSGNKDLESLGGAGRMDKWTLDISLATWDSMGQVFPYINGKATFISTTAASVSQLDKFPVNRWHRTRKCLPQQIESHSCGKMGRLRGCVPSGQETCIIAVG